MTGLELRPVALDGDEENQLEVCAVIFDAFAYFIARNVSVFQMLLFCEG